MKIFCKSLCKSLNGQTIILEVEPGDSIDSVKEKISVEQDISSNSLRLIFAGKNLEDYKTLADYNIKDNSTLSLLPRNRS